MSPRVKVALLVILAAAQFAIAAWSIARYESTLAQGVAYKIRIEPVDPADAFRGRYLAIRPTLRLAEPIGAEVHELIQGIQREGARAFVVLEVDADGFARAGRILAEPPPDGDYLEIRNAWPRPADDRQDYNIGFSFDRYYMNEALAPVAEKRYSAAMRRGDAIGAWVVVRVKGGVGVIEGLYLGGVPIEQAVRAAGRESEP